MNRKLTLAAVAVGCALALPASAAHAYVIGTHPSATSMDSPFVCGTGCTLVQHRLSNAEMRVSAWTPSQQAVVVRWTVRGTAGGQARLRRVRVGGDLSGTALGATEWVTLTGDVQNIPAALPVRDGDALGLDLSASTGIGIANLSSSTVIGWVPPLSDGAPPRANDGSLSTAIALEAEIEQDADADGLGDDTQDPCVNCSTDPGTNPPPTTNPGPSDPPATTPPPTDAYAAIRKSGPKATIARAALRNGRKVTVTVSNPYAFALKGKLQLKRGRKVVGKASLKLEANATRSVVVKVRKPARSLTAVATLRAPEGPARKTTTKLKVSKPKPGKGGIDGTYKGTGAAADWVMVIKDGVVTNFNGSITTFCTKAEKQEKHAFAMIGDDPDPRVAADGTFAWEATSGYGFDKLKFSGKVSGGKVTGKMMVESRPPINGVDPVSGMPRIEFEYCFAGDDDFTLTKK